MRTWRRWSVALLLAAVSCSPEPATGPDFTLSAAATAGGVPFSASWISPGLTTFHFAGRTTEGPATHYSFTSLQFSHAELARFAQAFRYAPSPKVIHVSGDMAGNTVTVGGQTFQSFIRQDDQHTARIDLPNGAVEGASWVRSPYGAGNNYHMITPGGRLGPYGNGDGGTASWEWEITVAYPVLAGVQLLLDDAVRIGQGAFIRPTAEYHRLQLEIHPVGVNYLSRPVVMGRYEFSGAGTLSR